MATVLWSKYPHVYHSVVTQVFLPKEWMEHWIGQDLRGLSVETGVRNDTDWLRQSGKLIAFRRSWKTGWAHTLLIARAGGLEVQVKEGSSAGTVSDTFAKLLACPLAQVP